MAPPTHMNIDQSRVIDPILSNHARGYSNADFIYTTLFPVVPVATRAAKRMVFGKEAFMRYNTQRAAGGRRGEISFGYSAEPVALRQHALSAKVAIEDIEEGQAVPGVDQGALAVQLVQDVIALDIECTAAERARNAANYGDDNKLTLSGTAQFSHADSLPDEVIADAGEQVRRFIGRRPNTLVLGPRVYQYMRRHPRLKARLTTATVERPLNLTELAAALDLRQVVVGEAVYATDDTGPMTDVWGDDAILAYVPTSARDYRVPSYGYTYRLRGYPLVSPPVWDNDHDSWKYPVKDELVPEIVGADAGFLIKSAVVALA